jgi:hypothetical protein
MNNIINYQKFSHLDNKHISLFFSTINTIFKNNINKYGYVLKDNIFDNKYNIYRKIGQNFFANNSEIKYKFQNKPYNFNIKTRNDIERITINIDFETDDTLYYIIPLFNKNMILPINDYISYLSHILMYLTEKKASKLVFIKFFEYSTQKNYMKDQNAIKKGIYQISSQNLYWKIDDINIMGLEVNEDTIFRIFSIISGDVLKIVNEKQLSDNNKMNISRKRNFSEIDTNTIANRVSRKNKKQRVTKHFGINYKEWVTPSETRNYLLNDTLLDWFKHYGEVNGYVKDNNFSGDYDYFKFLMDRGNEYENFVIQNLTERYPNDIKMVSKPGSYFSIDNVNRTNSFMRDGVPIIYQANLQSQKCKIYGIADLIIRSDLIQNYFDLPVEINPEHKSKDIYYVIDVKFSSIYEDVNGYIKNKGSIKCYKGQIYLYNKILEDQFETTLNHGFILGRRYIDKKGVIHDGKIKLGVINYADKDSEIVQKSLEAVDWLKWVRTNGKEHDPKNSNLKCFMPNMSNRLDYPWHNMKKELALAKKEITLLWNCGVKNRDIAINNDLHSFDQRHFNTDKLGLSENQNRVVKRIVRTNKKGKKLSKGSRSRNDIYKVKNKLRFYVDFEFLNTNDLTFDINSRVHLYMIGIGHINPLTQKWEFENYVSEYISEKSEEEICRKFIHHIYQKKQLYNEKDAVLLHWSKAEPGLFNKLQNKYNICQEIEWFDLLDTFRKCPITQENVYDFGLKNVAKNLKKNGLIETEWNSSVMDGLGASMAIINGLKETNNLNNIPEMEEIVYYNEVDCKVLSEIYNVIT